MEKLLEQAVVFHGFFSPFYCDGVFFIDGGLLNNVPVNEVKLQGADIVIGVKFHADEIEDDSSLMDVVMKSIDIMGSKISEESLKMSDLVLDVYTDKVGLLDVEKLDKCYQYGYECVVRNLEEIRRVCG